MDALLLDRRTYDIFAAFWPKQVDGVDGGIATLFNGIPKYVASRGDPDQSVWTGGTRQRRPDIARGSASESGDVHPTRQFLVPLGVISSSVPIRAGARGLIAKVSHPSAWMPRTAIGTIFS